MTGHALVGLAAALLVEARHWTKLRWDFDETAFVRAWHLCLLLILFGTVTVWLDGAASKRIYVLFAWLPVLLLPLQFVQSYGTRDRIPVHVFTVTGRSRIERERKLGHMVDLPEISFDHVMLVAILLGAALGDNASHWLFVPGLVVLIAWTLRRVRGERTPLPAWFASILVVIAVGVIGHLTMQELHQWLTNGVLRLRGIDSSDYRYSHIQLDGLREQKNTSRIFWRLRDLDGPPPQLLRTASFNVYLNGIWQARPTPDTDPFAQLDLFVTGPDDAPYRVVGEHAIDDPVPAGLPRFTLRGAVARNTLLPMPEGLRSLRDPQADSLEVNSLGTVRIEPIHSILDTRLSWHDHHDLETPPWTEGTGAPDLKVPEHERGAIRGIIDDLELGSASFDDKLTAMRLFFLRDFQYSRYLDLPPLGIGHKDNPVAGAIGRFLTEGRRGHCEYFATATTLLLREAGVPARYTIGFAAVEQSADGAEVVVRGTHAHAWCRAWDQGSGRWIDVDLTPPDWAALERGGLGRFQQLTDWWQRLREDFTAWRIQPGNIDRVTTALIIIGVLLAGYVATRLWLSRRRHPDTRAGRSDADHLPDALRRLARRARRRIGPRPVGLPLGSWLARLDDSIGPAPELDELIRIHARLRFDPAGPEPGDESRLAELARSLTARLRQRPS